jgi:phage protein U
MNQVVAGATESRVQVVGAKGPETAGSTSATAAIQPAVAPAGRALVVRSGATTLGWQMGWYEIVATAIIRQNCCREAVPIKLPETTGWCQQLQNVVRQIASDSAKVGDISPGVRSFDDAVTCLLAQGKHVGYSYKVAPTNQQKSAFQQFLKHAAEADAQRASRRR